MADFNDNSQKGSVLMQQALKKYAEGDFEGGDKDRKEANRYYDLASAEINSEAGKMTQLYGESRNFGIIYNVFEQNMDNLLETKNGKKIIKDVYNLIKNNNILSEQFKIYDMFEKTDNIENGKDFINEAMSLIKNFDKNIVKENNEKLISLIRKNKLDEYVYIPEETENLYEAIEFVMLNKKDYNNVNDFLKAQKVIIEHIEKNKNVLKEEKNNTFDNLKEEIDKVQNTIDENINEDEKKLLDVFTNPTVDTKKVFENYKKQTLNKINEALEKSEESEKIAWKNIYEKIDSKKFSDVLSENITNCAEMLEICSTFE